MTSLPAFDFDLGEDIDALRDLTATFVRRELAPRADAIDRTDTFPRDLWPQLGALGLLGLTVEPEWGGAGLGYLAHCVVMEEISRGSGSVGLSYGAHANLLRESAETLGHGRAKKPLPPGLISGEALGALAMSEPNAGSDVMSLKLRAMEDGDGYRLNGRKFWITNGPSADLLIVYATLDPALGTKGVTAFLIERADAGFSCAQKLDKLGMRGSETGELVFDDCWIPKDRVLGTLGGGAAVLMSGLDYERIVLAGGPLGLMAAALDCMAPYLQTREQFEPAHRAVPADAGQARRLLCCDEFRP